jgi:hypothetical protein
MSWRRRTESSGETILNFRLPIFDFDGLEKLHEQIFWNRFLDSCSDNRKSKIENPKRAVIFAIALTFALGGAVAQTQGAICRATTLTGAESVPYTFLPSGGTADLGCKG